jgi:hypothetical protein
MTDKAWKASERRNSRKIDNVGRTPLSGSNGAITASDSLSEYWFLENKLRANVALFNLFSHVNDLAIRRKKKPLMVFFSNGEKYAVFRIKEFGILTTQMHLPRYDSIFDGSWYVETEYNDRMPYRDLYEKTAEKAKLENKVPLVIIHPKAKQNDMVIMTLNSFLSHLPEKISVIEVPAQMGKHKTGRGGNNGKD